MAAATRLAPAMWKSATSGEAESCANVEGRESGSAAAAEVRVGKGRADGFEPDGGEVYDALAVLIFCE